MSEIPRTDNYRSQGREWHELQELFEDAKHRLGANGTEVSESQVQLLDTLIELIKEKR